jgi:hypothetical protein
MVAQHVQSFVETDYLTDLKKASIVADLTVILALLVLMEK